VCIVSHIIDVTRSDTLLDVCKSLPEWVDFAEEIWDEWLHTRSIKKD